MTATRQDRTRNTDTNTLPEPGRIKIDRNAPAVSKNSLGAQSVRDGRPSTDDSVVEAMDEEDPPPASN